MKLQEFIGSTIAPDLQQKGFKKNHLTWSRKSDAIVQILNIQPSHWNDECREDFTVNIGFWIEPLWKICWGKDSPGSITIEESYPVFRVGQLLEEFSPAATDLWWTFERENDIQDKGRDLKSTIDVHCVPFLSGFRRREEIYELLASLPRSLFTQPSDKLYWAILTYICGDESTALGLLREFEHPSLEAWNSRAKAVKSRLEEYAY